jgi:hypothetical protein
MYYRKKGFKNIYLKEHLVPPFRRHTTNMQNKDVKISSSSWEGLHLPLATDEKCNPIQTQSLLQATNPILMQATKRTKPYRDCIWLLYHVLV